MRGWGDFPVFMLTGFVAAWKGKGDMELVQSVCVRVRVCSLCASVFFVCKCVQ